MLFNQFHDLAAGSGIGVIYKDAQKDYDVVRWSTNEIRAGALETVDEKINTRPAKAIPVVVYNPLGWERSGDVSVKVQIAGAERVLRVDPDASNKPVGSDTRFDDEQTGVAELRFHVSEVPALGYKVSMMCPARQTRIASFHDS